MAHVRKVRAVDVVPDVVPDVVEASSHSLVYLVRPSSGIYTYSFWRFPVDCDIPLCSIAREEVVVRLLANIVEQGNGIAEIATAEGR